MGDTSIYFTATIKKAVRVFPALKDINSIRTQNYCYDEIM